MTDLSGSFCHLYDDYFIMLILQYVGGVTVFATLSPDELFENKIVYWISTRLGRGYGTTLAASKMHVSLAVSLLLYADALIAQRYKVLPGKYRFRLHFIDGNVNQHRTLAVNDFLENGDIRRMNWCTRSPDRDTIEHDWGILKEQWHNANLIPGSSKA